MKARIKSHTDLNQSRTLAEFLPYESADMKWFVPADNEGEFIKEVTFINSKSEYNLFDKVTDWDDTPYVPAWSLAALIGVLPSATLDSSDSHCYRIRCMKRFTEWHDNAIDACVDMIIKLHERKLL